MMGGMRVVQLTRDAVPSAPALWGSRSMHPDSCYRIGRLMAKRVSCKDYIDADGNLLGIIPIRRCCYLKGDQIEPIDATNSRC